MRVAVTIDALAVYVFEHQIRAPAGGDAGIDQPRDMRVGQSGKQAALATESIERKR